MSEMMKKARAARALVDADYPERYREEVELAAFMAIFHPDIDPRTGRPLAAKDTEV